jgi:hypothetical protein
VSRVDVRELELALSVGARVVALGRSAAALGPAAELLRLDHLLLEAVDALDEAGKQRRRVATDLVTAQRQVVDPLEQQRQPVGGADRREQRVEPGLERLIAQDPLAELVRRVHGQLVVGRLDQGLEAYPQIRRGGGRWGDHQRLVGGRPLLDQPSHSPDENVGLAGAGSAQHQQWPPAVRDGRELRAIQAVQRSGHAS